MSESLSKLIIGLGNPGKEYEKTRHNLGFLVIRELAKRWDAAFEKNIRLKSLVASTTHEGIKVHLILPQTFMNNSGVAVKAAVEKFETGLSEILVVCDDLNLDFAALRVRPQGSDGGHNGLRSIISHLQSREFSRLRLGIGRPNGKHEVIDFVLTGFERDEQKEIESFIGRAADACEVWLTEGTNKAMDQFNKRTGNEQV